MFKRLKITVVLGKSPIVIPADKPLLEEAVECPECAPLPQQRLPARIDELEGLAEELYLPDAAITPFDIILLEVASMRVLSLLDLLNGRKIKILSEDKRPYHLHEIR